MFYEEEAKNNGLDRVTHIRSLMDASKAIQYRYLLSAVANRLRETLTDTNTCRSPGSVFDNLIIKC